MASRTTNNAGTLENAAKGGSNIGYVVDNNYLEDIFPDGSTLTRSEARQLLKDKISLIVAEFKSYLVDQSVRITVGKTAVTARKGLIVDRLNKNTWVYADTSKASIGKRWVTTYKKEDYATIVPFVCISKECVPAHIQYPAPDATRYALDLEEDLSIELKDILVDNKTYHRGNMPKKPTAHALLYVALKIVPLEIQEQLPDIPSLPNPSLEHKV